MISRNIRLNIEGDYVEGSGGKPFLMKPAGKDYLWGGNRLNDEYGKDMEMQPLAETWECSTHPDGQSIVASGDIIAYCGKKSIIFLHSPLEICFEW